MTNQNNTISVALSKIVGVKNFFHFDSNIRSAAPVLPTVLVQSATIFNEYRDIVANYIFDLLSESNKKPFIAHNNETKRACTKIISNNDNESVNQTSLHQNKDVCVTSDLIASSKAGKSREYTTMICCGSALCNDYELLCCEQHKDKERHIRTHDGIRCKNFSDNIFNTNLYKYNIDPNISILVVDSSIGFGNYTKYPFGLLSDDIDKLLNNVDVVAIVNSREQYTINKSQHINTVEQIALHHNSNINIVHLNVNHTFKNNEIPHIFFSSSTIFNNMNRLIVTNNTKLLDCIRFTYKHKYEVSEIRDLLSTADNSGTGYDNVRLLTTHEDYVSICNMLRDKINRHLNNDVLHSDEVNKDGGIINKIKNVLYASTESVTNLKELLTCFESKTDIIDSHISNNREFNKMIQSVV